MVAFADVWVVDVAEAMGLGVVAVAEVVAVQDAVAAFFFCRHRVVLEQDGTATSRVIVALQLVVGTAVGRPCWLTTPTISSGSG